MSSTTEIEIGSVSIIPAGEYSSDTQYERLSVVTYEGSAYIAIQTNKGQAVTDTNYWFKLVEKGAKGDGFNDAKYNEKTAILTFTNPDGSAVEVQLPLKASEQQKLQGTSFHIPDSAEAPMKISPRGNDIEQDTREGYNLLDVSKAYQVTKSGVTLTVDKEKQEITLNGNCTADNTTFALNMPLECKAGDYTKGFKFVGGSITIPSGKTSTINLQDSNWVGFVTNLANNDVFTNQTISSDLSIGYTVIRCDSGCVYNNYKIKPFLANGSNKSYEQYGAMPSLDFPSPVKHVGGKVKSYNIIDFTNNLLSEKNGVKATILDDKKVIFNGTPTASWGNFLTVNINITDLLEDGKTYTLKQTKYDGFLYQQIKTVTADNKETYIASRYDDIIFTVDKSIYPKYLYMIQMADIANFTGSYNNYEVGFMLYKGTEDKPYLPYGDIGSVYDIANINKNLFDKNKRDSLNSFYKTDGSIGTSSSSWYITNIKVKPNTNYYLSGNNFSNTTACIVLLDKNKKYIKTIGGYTNTHLITTTNDTEYIGLSIPTHSSVKDVDTLMLEEGNTATDYTPHQEENHSLDLTNLPLYSDKDYIYKKDDKWYVYNEWGKYTFNGTEITRIAGENADTIQFQCVNLAIKKVGLSNISSNYFKSYYGDVNKETILGGSSNTIIQFLINKDRNITTVEGLNALFKKLYDEGNPIYAIYELITPTETEITDKKVIAQLEELYNTYAYDEVTNISVDNPILSAELVLDVLYYQKTALGLETKVSYEEYSKLLKRVEELENVILTLGGTI